MILFARFVSNCRIFRILVAKEFTESIFGHYDYGSIPELAFICFAYPLIHGGANLY